jgi:predicted nucleotidyltransferase
MANQTVADTFKHFVEDLRSTHGDNLASVVLYGSAAAGDQVKQRSDYNLLVALNRITPEDLRLAQAPVREWQRLGHPLPVYFTVGELNDAADVFPIEFRQMERARRVLYGRDPFEFVELSDANLRHQTEYELRSKLIQLRRLYIPASASTDKLTALMKDSLASFASLFRAVLLLKGAEPPVAKRETVRATVKLLGLDAEPFERIFDLRETGARGGAAAALTDPEANDLFAAYLAQIDRVIEVVDKIESE